MIRGWTVDVRCPHGEVVRVDLDFLLTSNRLMDPCGEARLERLFAEASRKPTFAERRAERKRQRKLAGT